jgi:hypothetical protein
MGAFADEATEAEALAGEISGKYMSPLRVAQAIAALAGGDAIWVRFDAAGTIIGSNGVSSVTKNGNGYYTVNLTEDMPGSNYGVLVSGHRDATNYLPVAWSPTHTMSTIDVRSYIINTNDLTANTSDGCSVLILK